MTFYEIYREWCDKTDRGGGIIIGPSIKEFLEYLKTKLDEQAVNSVRPL